MRYHSSGRFTRVADPLVVLIPARELPDQVRGFRVCPGSQTHRVLTGLYGQLREHLAIRGNGFELASVAAGLGLGREALGEAIELHHGRRDRKVIDE